MRRREFVRFAIGATLVGCSEERPPPAPRVGEPEPVEPEVEEPAPIALPAPVEVRPATDADWDAFARSLRGRLVRPRDADYASAKQLYDPAFDSIRPRGIAFVANEEDVQRSIAFARAHALPFAARSGGHSYGGYSTCAGLVCDVGGFSRVEVEGDRAVVGSGVRLIDLYAATAPHGRAVPGGTCASVGIAGLALGGGQGVLGRKLGLTCDSIASLRLVTAGGEILECSDEENEDLFWACRGAGGGNFGVVTSFTFRAHPISDLARFGMSFPWEAAADVIAAWQEWAPNGDDALWSALHANAAGTWSGIRIGGVYAGPEPDLRAALETFYRRVGTRPRSPRTSTATYLDTMRGQASCSERSIEECHLPSVHPSGQLGRRSHEGFSHIYDRPMSSAAIAALIEAVAARGQDPLLARGAGGVALDSLGGAINRVAPDATAFAHRSGICIAQCSTHWPPRASAEEIAANRAWHANLRRATTPHASGHAYVNYIDPHQPDWERAYYGASLDRLRQIKARRDPDGFFRFAQSISART